MWVVTYQTRLPVEATREHRYMAYHHKTLAIKAMCDLLAAGIAAEIEWRPYVVRLP